MNRCVIETFAIWLNLIFFDANWNDYSVVCERISFLCSRMKRVASFSDRNNMKLCIQFNGSINVRLNFFPLKYIFSSFDRIKLLWIVLECYSKRNAIFGFKYYFNQNSFIRLKIVLIKNCLNSFKDSKFQNELKCLKMAVSSIASLVSIFSAAIDIVRHSSW